MACALIWVMVWRRRMDSVWRWISSLSYCPLAQAPKMHAPYCARFWGLRLTSNGCHFILWDPNGHGFCKHNCSFCSFFFSPRRDAEMIWERPSQLNPFLLPARRQWNVCEAWLAFHNRHCGRHAAIRFALMFMAIGQFALKVQAAGRFRIVALPCKSPGTSTSFFKKWSHRQRRRETNWKGT